MYNETYISYLMEFRESYIVYMSVFRITYKIFFLGLIGLVALYWKRQQALGDLSKL